MYPLIRPRGKSGSVWGTGMLGGGNADPSGAVCAPVGGAFWGTSAESAIAMSCAADEIAGGGAVCETPCARALHGTMKARTSATIGSRTLIPSPLLSTPPRLRIRPLRETPVRRPVYLRRDAIVAV